MRLDRLLASATIIASLGLFALGGRLAGQAAAQDNTYGLPAETLKGLSGELVFWDTSGGAVVLSYRETLFKNFTDASGVRVVDDYFCCDLSKLQAQHESGNIMWNVMEIAGGAEFLVGSERGYFEKLDPARIPFDRLEPGTFTEYGFRSSIYAAAVTWNTNVFPPSGKQPTTLEDVYDTTNFPGRRCLIQTPDIAGNFEAALLADGVAADKLYPLDLDRAFKKMDTIKDQIVWGNNGQDVIQNLIAGECDIGITYSGRPYDAVRTSKAPVAEAFGHAVLGSGWLAINKGTKNLDAAYAFLAMWITNKEGQIARVLQVPYPVPAKGLSQPSDYPPEVRDFVPDVQKGLFVNEKYYAENRATINERWTAWLSE